MPTISLKEINRLAVPAIFAGIAEPLISLADTAIVGRLGSDALGGLGIAAGVFTTLFWVLGQTRTAISSLVSQYLGKQRLEAIQTLVPQAIVLNILLGIAIAALTIPFTGPIFGFFGATDTLLDSAREYYNIRALGFPLILGAFAIFGVFRGMQNTVWAMQISLTGAAVNIVLDVLLVYGIDGLVPAYGVAGAAMASVAAQVVMLILSFIYLARQYSHVYRVSFKLNPEISRLVGMTGNMIIRTVALNIAFLLATKYATSYGTEQIAAHTIALNIWLFSAFFIDGYANAGNALGGRLLGSEDYSELYRVGVAITKISVYIAIGLSVIYGIGYFITGQFFSKEPQVIAVFEQVYWLVILMQPINAIAFSLDGVFKGMGKTALLRNVLLIATFLGFIPALLLTDWLGWELYSVWFSFFVWMVVRSGLLALVFKGRYGTGKKSVPQ